MQQIRAIGPPAKQVPKKEDVKKIDKLLPETRRRMRGGGEGQEGLQTEETKKRRSDSDVLGL